MRRPSTMTVHGAIAIVNDVIKTDNETKLEAFQLLIDTGIVWTMEECYSKTANILIEAGLLQPAPEDNGTMEE